MSTCRVEWVWENAWTGFITAQGQHRNSPKLHYQGNPTNWPLARSSFLLKIMLKEFSLKRGSCSLEELRTWHSRTICSHLALGPSSNKNWKWWALQLRQNGRQKGKKRIPWNMLQTQPGPLAVGLVQLPMEEDRQTDGHASQRCTNASTLLDCRQSRRYKSRDK